MALTFISVSECLFVSPFFFFFETVNPAMDHLATGPPFFFFQVVDQWDNLFPNKMSYLSVEMLKIMKQNSVHTHRL